MRIYIPKPIKLGLDRIDMIHKIRNQGELNVIDPPLSNLVHLVNPVFRLFVSQALNRIQTRSLARGPDAED